MSSILEHGHRRLARLRAIFLPSGELLNLFGSLMAFDASFQ
jgi:hypothetical protein